MAGSRDPKTEHDRGTLLEEARPEVAKPPMYQVVVLNDDYTPMDFVVTVLETFFAMTRQKATQVMLHVHTKGVGVAGVYTHDVAQTKIDKVHRLARAYEYPLKLSMEPEDD